MNVSSLDIKSVDVITDSVEVEEVFNEVTDIVEESQSLLADDTDTAIEETSIEFVATNESVQMLNFSKVNDLINIVNSNLIHQQSQVVPFKQYILKAKEKYY